MLTDFNQLPFESRDTLTHDAAILLELGFTFAAQIAFAPLAGQVSPGPGEAGQGILHAGERDL